MHRPSSAKLWQMPTPPTVLPTMPALPRRTVPLDEHDTSYLADSASTFSLWSTFSFIVRGDRVVGTKVMRIGWFRVGGRRIFCGQSVRRICTDGRQEIQVLFGRLIFHRTGLKDGDFSVSLYKEYSCLILNKLEGLPCFGVMIWQPS